MEVVLKENEKIEDLEYKNMKIIQDKTGFCFGIDAVILSGFAKDNVKDSNILDIGTGTGIISILLAAKTNAKKITGIDVQEEVCEMANRSVILNNLQDRIQIINKNIKDIEEIIKKGSIDIVVTNPPYQKEDTGLINNNEKEKISRHEVMCTFEDICKSANFALKHSGSMYIVHRPERLVDILFNLRKNNLEPKEIKFVEPKSGQKPNLVLIKAVKGGKPFLKIHNPLVVYNSNGEYTQEILELYDKNRKELK